MANGRVITGFSKPYVALYAESSGTISYSSGIALARGVEVSVEVETSEDNNFYADNIVAETAAGAFTGGTATLTVDGLKDAARKLILGLPAATGGWTAFGDEMSIPYVGIGFVVRYMEAGTTTYMPVVLKKALFSVPNISAATQAEEIDWQTEELTAKLFRDDSANHDWMLKGDAQTTEALAEAPIKTLFGIS